MQKQKTIGMRLREAFKCLGLNITEVARITGIPYPTLQDYLNDKRIPGGSNLQKISMHLHISIDWLLTGEGPMFREKEEPPPAREDLSPELLRALSHPTIRSIALMLSEMSEDDIREILKRVEEKKLLKFLLKKVQELDEKAAWFFFQVQKFFSKK